MVPTSARDALNAAKCDSVTRSWSEPGGDWDPDTLTERWEEFCDLLGSLAKYAP